MSGRHGRHARSRWEWGSQPSRSADRQAAAAEQIPGLGEVVVKRPPGKKDKTRCKGNGGRDHVPELTMGIYWSARTCGWKPVFHRRTRTYVAGWGCGHRARCRHCGKVLRESWDLADSECPAYPGTREQRAAAEAEAVKWAERSHGWHRRKPPITGQLGYRKPKKARQS